MSAPAVPALRLPRILLSEAIGQRLVQREQVGDSDLWLVFEKGFCFLQGESQYGGGCDIEEREPEIRNCLPIMVKLGLIEESAAEAFRAELNAAHQRWLEERDRVEFERLAKKLGR